MLRRSTRLVTYTVKMGNIIMPSAASSTDSTRPVTVTAIILEPTVVTSMNAHHKASPYPFTRGLLPQNDLAAGGVFRRDDVDGLVGVHIGKAVLGQLVGKAGANDLCAVQTEHGIHDGAVLVSVDQLLCHGLGLGKAGLLGGHVDVIVDVAVAGGKMSLGHPQEQFAFAGGKLDHVDHCTALLFSPGAAAPQNTKQRGDPC